MAVTLLQQRDLILAEQIRQLLFASYQIEANLIGVVDFYPLRRTAQQIAQSDSCFRGILRDAGLQAVIELEDTGLDEILIASLGVHPACFRQGLASQLLQNLLQIYPNSLIRVSTAAVNRPALQLYAQFGFRLESQSQSPDGIPLQILTRAAN